MQKTIEKIHRKFDTASEKLLAEAKAIINAPMVMDAKKIERLQKIGFNTAKPIKDSEEDFKKKESAKEMVEAIEYYQLHYPNYKFISEEMIEKICKKYGLLYGESRNYLGDIPEKNICEIEAFKMREEDYYEETIWTSLSGIMDLWRPSVQPVFDRFGSWSFGIDPIRAEEQNNLGNIGLIPAIKSSGNSVAYEPHKKVKPDFRICAPQKDFNTAGYEVEKGYKLVYDPIVLQPVKFKKIKGALVVSKWGLEGQDESLVNEKMN